MAFLSFFSSGLSMSFALKANDRFTHHLLFATRQTRREENEKCEDLPGRYAALVGDDGGWRMFLDRNGRGDNIYYCKRAHVP